MAEILLKLALNANQFNHNNKSTCFRYATGVDMVPYASGSIENLQKNPGSTSGPVDFASGSILNGRDYAISFTTGDSKFFFTAKLIKTLNQHRQK